MQELTRREVDTLSSQIRILELKIDQLITEGKNFDEVKIVHQQMKELKARFALLGGELPASQS